MKIKHVKVSEIKPSMIVHKTLQSGFIERVNKYKEILKEVETIPTAETIRNFQRDLNPENELQLWEKMATLYKEQSECSPNLTLEDKRLIFKTILSDFV